MSVTTGSAAPCTPSSAPDTSSVLLSDRPVAGRLPVAGLADCRFTLQLPLASAVAE